MENQIRKFIDIIKNYNSTINENVDLTRIKIEITPIESDERSNKSSKKKYDVNYQITVDGNLIEIDGTLYPQHTGRDVEYIFEPGAFIDAESEEYYNNNWEDIEDEILEKFYKVKH